MPTIEDIISTKRQQHLKALVPRARFKVLANTGRPACCHGEERSPNGEQNARRSPEPAEVCGNRWLRRDANRTPVVCLAHDSWELFAPRARARRAFLR